MITTSIPHAKHRYDRNAHPHEQYRPFPARRQPRVTAAGASFGLLIVLMLALAPIAQAMTP